MKRELWFVTGWYSTPLFCALAEDLSDRYAVRFIAHDSYSHQYLLSRKMRVFKRSQRSFDPDPMLDYFNQTVKMDAAFTAQRAGHLERWVAYFSKRAAGYRRWLKSLWGEHDPHAVIIWNGMWHYEIIAADLGREIGAQTVFFENGYFPSTAHIDSQGVNACAEIIDIATDMLAPEKTEQDLDHFLRLVKNEFSELKRYNQSGDLVQTLPLMRKLLTGVEVLCMDIPFIGKEFVEKLVIMVKSRRKRVLLSSKGPLPDRYLFLPLQVSADSQLILNSPWIKTPAATIALVADVLRELGSDLKLVVKEHPMEDAEISFDQVSSKYPEIYWAQEGSLQELLEGAVGVVTVNSSVGFHALLFETPVVCLGAALYARPGMAVQCSDRSAVQNALSDLSLIQPDMNTVRRFAQHLYLHYCAPYHRGCFTKDDVLGINQQVLRKLGHLD